MVCIIINPTNISFEDIFNVTISCLPRHLDRVSTVPWIPWITGNILGSEKTYLENPWINFGAGNPWKKIFRLL